MGKIRIAVVVFFVSWSAAFGQMNTERILTIGRNALYFEDYVLSIQYFNQIINAKPYLFEPFFFRAYAKYNLGDFAGAIEDCTDALNINPFYIDAYIIRGISKQQMGDYESANDDFNSGLEYDVTNTSLIMNRGVGKLEMKNYEGAIDDFTKAIKEKSGFMLAYLNRGRAWLELADTTKALTDFNKAVEINPFHTRALGIRGALLSDLKQYSRAIEDYNVAIRMEPKEPGLFINRGLIKYFSNDLMGAIADYNTAIELDPNSLIAYYNRGLLRAQIGDVNRAVEDFDNVLKIEPDNYTARLNRALINIDLGEHLLAIDDLDKIIAQYPDFPIAFYARSQSKQALGDKNGAMKDYNTAYSLEFENNKQKKSAKKDKEQALAPGKDDPKESRKSNDKDVRNYKKVIVLDDKDDSDKTGFGNSIRGRVQYRNIAIDLEQDFTLSYYPDNSVLDKTQYYSRHIEEYNLLHKSKPIYITNAVRALNEGEINEYFDKIERLSTHLKFNENDKYAYFERALQFVFVKDFNSALNDLNKVLDLDRNFTIAYFARGVVRYKMVEFIRSVEDVSQTNITLDIGGGLSKAQSAGKPKTQERILDYDLIMHDYNKLEDLSPDFAFMYFNRGNLRATLKDFKAAIADYTQAIKCEPELAEAYFNRGLTYIYLGEAEKGNRDLSKAGELGLFKAYNVLKRYGINQQ